MTKDVIIQLMEKFKVNHPKSLIDFKFLNLYLTDKAKRIDDTITLLKSFNIEISEKLKAERGCIKRMLSVVNKISCDEGLFGEFIAKYLDACKPFDDT